jgi:hypothetical protein
MVDSVVWNPANWSAAVAALRSRSSVSELLSLYEGGAVTSLEVLDAVYEHCYDKPAVAAEIARALHERSSERVRWLGHELQCLVRQREDQIKNVEQIRRTSPLQPGTRLILSGGYWAGNCSPWWLSGRENYKATFIAFAEREAGKMPVAYLELDNEIDLTEGGGLRHKGRYALLRLLQVANWTESETVTVHVVEVLPDNVEAFYLSHPFGTEVETHATYAIEK